MAERNSLSAPNSVKKQSTSALPEGFVLSSGGQSYRIGKVLGRGGFGITYSGTWRERDMTVAIKEFFPAGMVSRAADCSLRALVPEREYAPMTVSFLKEIQVLNGLRNLSCVMKVYQCFYANNTAYYVMEFVSGRPLNKVIAESGLISASPACLEQFRLLMRELGLLHSYGVIHRDISPDNIMLTDKGSFKLVDFGSARSFAGGAELTVNLKKEFAPPEQYSPTGQRPYTDVYALAATMYYSFTGRVLPPASERLKKPSALSMELLPLNAAQKAAMQKALSLSPRDRFQSMQEFETAFFEGQPKNAEPFPREEIPCVGGVARLLQQPVVPVLSAAMFLIALVIQILL